MREEWIKVWVDGEGNLHVDIYEGPQPEVEFAWTA